MSIVIDLIVLAIIVLVIFICAKKGFVKTLIESLGVVLAILTAFFLTDPICGVVYDNFIEPSIISSAKEEAKEQTGLEELPDDFKFTIDKDDLPDFVIEKAKEMGVNLEDYENEKGDKLVFDSEAALQDAVSKTVKPPITKLISSIVFFVLVIVLIIVFKILAKVLNKMVSFSVVGKLNKLLGGVLGIFKGTTIAIAFCTIISVLANLGINLLFFTAENIDGTILFKALANILSL